LRQKFCLSNAWFGGRERTKWRKIKKIIRDNGSVFTQERREELSKELGDVLWYVANLAAEIGLDLDAIAQRNIEKLRSRRERNGIAGFGRQPLGTDKAAASERRRSCIIARSRNV